MGTQVRERDRTGVGEMRVIYSGREERAETKRRRKGEEYIQYRCDLLGKFSIGVGNKGASKAAVFYV